LVQRGSDTRSSCACVLARRIPCSSLGNPCILSHVRHCHSNRRPCFDVNFPYLFLLQRPLQTPLMICQRSLETPANGLSAAFLRPRSWTPDERTWRVQGCDRQFFVCFNGGPENDDQFSLLGRNILVCDRRKRGPDTKLGYESPNKNPHRSFVSEFRIRNPQNNELGQTQKRNSFVNTVINTFVSSFVSGGVSYPVSCDELLSLSYLIQL
jgi:hypothetical protein